MLICVFLCFVTDSHVFTTAGICEDRSRSASAPALGTVEQIGPTALDDTAGCA